MKVFHQIVLMSEKFLFRSTYIYESLNESDLSDTVGLALSPNVRRVIIIILIFSFYPKHNVRAVFHEYVITVLSPGNKHFCFAVTVDSNRLQSRTAAERNRRKLQLVVYAAFSAAESNLFKCAATPEHAVLNGSNAARQTVEMAR